MGDGLHLTDAGCRERVCQIWSEPIRIVIPSHPLSCLSTGAPQEAVSVGHPYHPRPKVKNDWVTMCRPKVFAWRPKNFRTTKKGYLSVTL